MEQGAGKTTLINMLSGMYVPTTGDAKILGFSIRSEMGQIRKSVGFCPQHNILYDILTVEEHLRLFAALKVGSVLVEALDLVLIASKGCGALGD